MVDDMDPFINKLLTTFPEFLKLTDSSPGQASASTSGPSAARTKTSKLEHGQSHDSKTVTALEGSDNASNSGENNVGESGWAIPDEFAEPGVSDWDKEGRPDLVDGTPTQILSKFMLDHGFVDTGSGSGSLDNGEKNVEESEWAVPNEFAGPEFSDWDKEERLDFSDDTPIQMLDKFMFDHGFDTETGSQSKSKGKQAEPRQAEMWKFEEANSKYADRNTLNSLSDVPHKLPASSGKYSAKRSVSPPLFDAIAQRVSILNYQKPGASGLRNEFHESSAASESSEHDGTVWNGFGYTGRLVATVGERPTANEHGLIPPIINWNEDPQNPKFVLRTPKPAAFGLDEPRDINIHAADAGLSADEWAKVPHEFRHLDQQILTTFWDFAYNPVIRQTVLNYKREAALAGEVLDLPNELLVAFVDIHEAAMMEGAKYIAGETVKDRKASILKKRRKMKAQAGLYFLSP